MHRSGPSAADTPLLRVSRPISACSRCECKAPVLPSSLSDRIRRPCRQDQGSTYLFVRQRRRANISKCDGKLPACTACEKSGRAGECSSANDQFAKGKERRFALMPHTLAFL